MKKLRTSKTGFKEKCQENKVIFECPKCRCFHLGICNYDTESYDAGRTEAIKEVLEIIDKMLEVDEYSKWGCDSYEHFAEQLKESLLRGTKHKTNKEEIK